MKIRHIALSTLFMAALSLHAGNVDIYTQLSSGSVTAEASSTNSDNKVADAVNGAGMTERGHVSNNLGEGMWLSGKSTTPVRYNKQLPEGAIWYTCILGDPKAAPVAIDQIRIWNYNQNQHTRRGLKKVYIHYSADGKKWAVLPCSGKNFHIIPESVGRNPEQYDYCFSFPTIRAKYICLTADIKEGNHYNMSDPIVARETKDMSQNPAYYGISEIRFYKKGKQAVASLPRITETHAVFSQGYHRTTQGPRREFHIDFNSPLYSGGKITFRLGNKQWSETIKPDPNGSYRYDGLFPAGYMTEAENLSYTFTSQQGNTESNVTIPAARRWTVAFFPHSHQDIGYTHRQNDVMKLQWRNLERAMQLADRTRNYPAEAQYHWNTEATWSIAGYLKEFKGTEKATRLIEAIKKGDICVNAPLGSQLSGIMRQEELMHLFDDAHSIESLTGVPCNTAMMSDVPGQTWGLATAMAFNGVKYYSPGPNYVPFYGKIGNDRAASLHIDWGDRPFYWTSQSGTDKVLVWQAGRGYSWFHGWLAGRLAVCGVEPIWEYLGELEGDRFPYDECYLRYTVHGDNGPPDELMPEVIRKWNEEYESPRFVIANSQEFFEKFEAKYGDRLPSFGGDMTPTWEDGAASTARETAMNRESAARIARAGILHAMYGSADDFSADSYNEAWKNTILFSEHTWGASASGSDPYSKFTLDLWAGKKMYADSAHIQSTRLAREALPASNRGNYIHVANTTSWDRTDIVEMEGSFDSDRFALVDGAGNTVTTQNLSTGKWIFKAENVLALSSSVYSIVPLKKAPKGAGKTESGMTAENHTLDNGIVKVEINPELGTISSLKYRGEDFEYVSGKGLNDYLYTERIGANPQGIGATRSAGICDNGPLAVTARIVSDAPGCDSLTRYITIYKGLDRVDIVNSIDKKDIISWENVRFVFPFNFPHPEVTMDLPMSEIHPEREQLSGVNKHYYSVQNGLSVGDLEHGICLTTLDAPFVEMGTPSGEDYRLNPRYGYGWWRSAQISPVIYSWVMTNTWRTNYKASQGGNATFRYSLLPGNPHDLCLKQHGQEREHPLTAFRSGSPDAAPQLFRLSGNHKIAVTGITPSADGKGYILRLHNMDKEVARTAVEWGAISAKAMNSCDWTETPGLQVNPEALWMQPFEYATFKIATK